VSALFESAHHLGILPEHLMASLMKAIGLHLFLLGIPGSNKEAFEFCHNSLVGLTDQGPRGSLQDRYPDGPWAGS
jgi:hypothetical protein